MRAVIHAEGVFLLGVKRAGSIIHAGGVRVGVLSSAPKARRWPIDWWRFVRAFRAATAAKPIRRTTADRLLSDLLERIEKLNGDDRFLGRVRKAVVFGSYIGDADHIGDIDVAVEILR